MSHKPTTSTYLDTIANLFQEARAWRMASLLLGATTAFLACALIYQAQNMPTVLVPFDFATSKGNVTVNTNGSLRGTSNEYLVNLALSDLSLITNFTPDTVVVQYERFLNRLTESLFGSQRDALREEAQSLRKDGATQAFFPNERTKVAADQSVVIVSGTLVRWKGDREIVRQPATYHISYSVFKGYFRVKSIVTQEIAKEAAKEALKNAVQ